METKEFILLDIDYVTRNGSAVIRLFGKLLDGRSIIALDKSFKHYMYMLPVVVDDCMNDLSEFDLLKIEKQRKRDGIGFKDFLKVTVKHPRDIQKFKKEIQRLSSVDDIREHDIPFFRRYLIDQSLYPMNMMQVHGRTLNKSSPDGTCTFEIQDKPKDLGPSLNDFSILSFKVEICNSKGIPSASHDPINMICFYSNHDFYKILSTKSSSNGFVETVENERALLKRFVEIVKSENPDIIAGYHSDNFDFPYLKNRAAKLGVKLNLGKDGSQIKFINGRRSIVGFKGMVHVDIYRVVRRYLQLNDHTVKKVYTELFKEDKVDIPANKIHSSWLEGGEELERLYKYNIEDVKAISQIAEKMLQLLIEHTRIVGQPLFEISRRGTGTQIKWYLIRKSHQIGDVIPNEAGRFERHVVGGYVEEPLKGLHENIVYFDFRSLYPSIIIAKNISPDTFTDDGDEKTCFIAPDFGYKFLKTPRGFIPSVVSELLEGRMRIKAEMQKCSDPKERQMLDFRQDAMKRLCNTIYGLFNHPAFRWYRVECSEAITAWGKEFLLETMGKAEMYGFKLLYADTDGFYASYTNEVE